VVTVVTINKMGIIQEPSKSDPCRELVVSLMLRSQSSVNLEPLGLRQLVGIPRKSHNPSYRQDNIAKMGKLDRISHA